MGAAEATGAVLDSVEAPPDANAILPGVRSRAAGANAEFVAPEIMLSGNWYKSGEGQRRLPPDCGHLQAPINWFLDEYNEKPKPFR